MLPGENSLADFPTRPRVSLFMEVGALAIDNEERERHSVLRRQAVGTNGTLIESPPGVHTKAGVCENISVGSNLPTSKTIPVMESQSNG